MIIKYLLALFAAAAVGAQAQQTGTSSPCNICGEGGEITNPDAVLLLQQQLPEVDEPMGDEEEVNVDVEDEGGEPETNLGFDVAESKLDLLSLRKKVN